MPITSENIKIIQLAEELASLIQHSKIGEEFRITKSELNSNLTAQKCISAFVRSKELYEETERFGEYHPDRKRLKKEMLDKKKLMDTCESVALFKQAENKFNELLYEISLQIGNAVSDQIKIPPAYPLFDVAGKSCSCGSGGSCGC